MNDASLTTTFIVDGLQLRVDVRSLRERPDGSVAHQHAPVPQHLEFTFDILGS